MKKLGTYKLVFKCGCNMIFDFYRKDKEEYIEIKPVLCKTDSRKKDEVIKEIDKHFDEIVEWLFNNVGFTVEEIVNNHYDRVIFTLKEFMALISKRLEHEGPHFEGKDYYDIFIIKKHKRRARSKKLKR